MENKIYEIAKNYKDSFAFNISCISKNKNEFNKHSLFKAPNHSWKNLLNKSQSNSEFNSYNWDKAVGLGTFTGSTYMIEVNEDENIVTEGYNYVIDIDGCSDFSFIKNVLRKLNLPDDYEWVIRSGSKNGFHIHYTGQQIEECSDDLAASTFPANGKYEKYFEKIEFLWSTHVILPPSIHGSGNKYEFVNGSFPKFSPRTISDETVMGFIEEFLDFDEVIEKDDYDQIFRTIKSKVDFLKDSDDQNLSKHFLDTVYLVLDIETSGIIINNNGVKQYPEIAQIAWVLANKKGNVIKKNSFIVDTPFLNKKNISIINFDFEIANEIKTQIKNVLEQLLIDIRICDYVVAHNINFDVNILGYYFNQLYGANPFENKKKICTMVSTTRFCNIKSEYGLKYPKLSELYYKLFDIEPTELHNAEIDVFYTLKCFRKLKSLRFYD